MAMAIVRIDNRERRRPSGSSISGVTGNGDDTVVKGRLSFKVISNQLGWECCGCEALVEKRFHWPSPENPLNNAHITQCRLYFCPLESENALETRKIEITVT